MMYENDILNYNYDTNSNLDQVLIILSLELLTLLL